MTFPGFMTIKDFFNYYVAGFIWLVNIVLFWLPIQDYANAIEKLGQVQAIIDKLNSLVIALALLIIPFIIGFMLTPLNNLVTKVMLTIFGDPKKWVVDYQEKSKWRLFLHRGKRLSRTNIRLVTQRLKKRYGNEKDISETKLAKWFYQIRAIIFNQKGEAVALVIRAQDLANLSGSLILPVLLLFVILFLKFLHTEPTFAWVCLGLGLGLCLMLGKRYLDMRTFWVKHTYRAFLALSATDKHEINPSESEE